MEENDLEKTFKARGFVEDMHIVLAKKDPWLLEKWTDIWDHIFKKSSLDQKTLALLRVASSSTIRVEKGIDHAIDAAVAAGASVEEVIDSIKVAFVYSGAPELLTSLSIVKKKFNL